MAIDKDFVYSVIGLMRDEALSHTGDTKRLLRAGSNIMEEMARKMIDAGIMPDSIKPMSKRP